jgi:creatinine amidohydrolase/Fe(II)-dependent formamide hydrolase-like protein
MEVFQLTRNLRELSSRDVNAYLRGGGDFISIPVGSTERLGPHLPAGARTYVCTALARLFAEAFDGVYSPAIPYAPVAHTFRQAGSADVKTETLFDYVRDVVDEMYRNGFSRVLIVTYDHYLRYSLPNEYFEETNRALLGVSAAEMIEGTRGEVSETSVALGAMRILGLADLAANCEKESRRLAGKAEAHVAEDSRRVAEVRGTLGFTMPPGKWEIAPDAKASAEEGEAFLRKMADGKKPHFEDWKRYQEFLDKRTGAPGRRGWDRGGHNN